MSNENKNSVEKIDIGNEYLVYPIADVESDLVKELKYIRRNIEKDLTHSKERMLARSIGSAYTNARLLKRWRLTDYAQKMFVKLQSRHIAKLNDEFRKDWSKGKVIFTTGVESMLSKYMKESRVKLKVTPVTTLYNIIREFNNFDEGNDPYYERDFGKITFNNNSLYFKIDYYDKSLKYGSQDPADGTLTKRVMTIMLIEEY
jgi:hypothetical protein